MFYVCEYLLRNKVWVFDLGGKKRRRRDKKFKKEKIFKFSPNVTIDPFSWVKIWFEINNSLNSWKPNQKSTFKSKFIMQMINDFQSLLHGPLVVREISLSGPPIPTQIKSIFCASRSTKEFQVVRAPEKFGNHWISPWVQLYEVTLFISYDAIMTYVP
jgi:hypothetical protein